MKPACEPIRVVHTLASLKRSSGGTSRSVPALCESLAALRLGVTLLSQAARWPADSDIIPSSALVRTELVASINLPRLRASFAPGFGRALMRLSADADILHDHGLWLPANHAAAHVARRRGIPIVVSPRGMLDAWSLRYRSWKKRVAWVAYQHADLRLARAFCVTSLQEAGSLRDLGLPQPIAVIPNGVDLPPAERSMRPDGRPRNVLFMSRIHPKKGLVDLIKAWATVRPAGWELVVAGPDEGGHRQAAELLVKEKGLRDQVRFTGPVEGADKLRLMKCADLFVLPTLSENFGLVVAEALASGIPVITTREAPWQDLVDDRCGWWVEPGPDSIAAALRSAMGASDGERFEMGLRGRALVERKYAWRAIAENVRGLYGWLLGRASRPDCVLG